MSTRVWWLKSRLVFLIVWLCYILVFFYKTLLVPIPWASWGIASVKNVFTIQILLLKQNFKHPNWLDGSCGKNGLSTISVWEATQVSQMSQAIIMCISDHTQSIETGWLAIQPTPTANHAIATGPLLSFFEWKQGREHMLCGEHSGWTVWGQYWV